MKDSVKKYSLIMLMAVLFMAGAISPSFPAPSEEERVIQSIKRVKPSIANIRAVGVRPATGKNFVETGSGIVFNELGYLVTNYHVVQDATTITVTLYNGKKFQATMAGKSPRDDLAVIKINSNGLKVPVWGNSNDLKIGQVAIAIGNPYKFDWSVSRGIISALDRKIEAGGIIYKDMIQTDAAINPGSSGGALIDSSGSVIGINTLVYAGQNHHSAQGLGFAIPTHRALKICKMLVSNKTIYPPTPWIGVDGINITPERSESYAMPVEVGVLITKVHPVGPARRGGLLKGDIVVKINESDIQKIEDFKKIISKARIGDTLKLLVWRGEKCRTIKVKVAQRSGE